jgi:hypothetical protein
MYTVTSLDTHSAQKFARDFEDVFYQGDYRAMAAVYTADAKLFAEGAPVVGGGPPSRSSGSRAASGAS